MAIQMTDNGYTAHRELFERVVSEYELFTGSDLHIEFRIDREVGPAESFLLERRQDTVFITGADTLGLYYGIGKLAHNAWRIGEPSLWGTVTAPRGSFRAVYWCAHFYNWFAMAPEEEQARYLEELLLWGYNTVVSGVGIVNCETENDPAFIRDAEKCRKIFAAAKRLGMHTGLLLSTNQSFRNMPKELAADLSYDIDGMRGSLGQNVCPEAPGALAYLRQIWQARFRPFADIDMDYIIPFPYDEGGCGCEKCRPWGANGYLRSAEQMVRTARTFFPHCQCILSTWLFDVPGPQNEYEGLYRGLADGMEWCSGLMADNHNAFPEYPLQHPLLRPVFNFSEISMWGLFPWGGWGAHPLPKRFQRIWESTRHVVSGGMPYAEGIYEDSSMVQMVGYYWKKDRHYRDILEEYAAFEFGPRLRREAVELMEKIEINTTRVANGEAPDMDTAAYAAQLAERINTDLPEKRRTAWRWRFLFDRAMLDRKRYSYYTEHTAKTQKDLWLLKYKSGRWLREDPKAQEMLRELMRLDHAVPYNGWNAWTLPPVDGMDIVPGLAEPEDAGT